MLGENGAGKSTLMKIIYGVVKPDAGDSCGREPVGPSRARRTHATLGIGMVFQHFSLFDTLTVVENIALALDEESRRARHWRRISEVSEQYGLPIDPDGAGPDAVGGERQRVEIVRCLLQEPKLLIMDEPTSVLTPQAVRKLVRDAARSRPRAARSSIISHKLDEIRRLCDTATVLRGGKVTGIANRARRPATASRG